MKHLNTYLVILSVAFSFLSINIDAQKKDVKIGLEIGNKAPELDFISPEGKLISLSSLKGKVVLIDFWASWCGPCRRENPNVVNAYDKYKDEKFKVGKGFTIYSVSLDNNKERWESAIEADNLKWPNHVSDLKGWRSAAATKYGIRSIPDNFLIDENGIIIAKRLRGENLENVLKQLIK